MLNSFDHSGSEFPYVSRTHKRLGMIPGGGGELFQRTFADIRQKETAPLEFSESLFFRLHLVHGNTRRAHQLLKEDAMVAGTLAFGRARPVKEILDQRRRSIVEQKNLNMNGTVLGGELDALVSPSQVGRDCGQSASVAIERSDLCVHLESMACTGNERKQ